MKKKIIIIISIFLLLFALIYVFISSRTLDCSINLNEDEVSTKKEIKIHFLLSKQTKMREEISIKFNEYENYIFYYEYLKAFNKNADITKNDTSLQIESIKNINYKNIDLSTVEFNTKLNRKQLKKYLINNGYTCN